MDRCNAWDDVDNFSGSFVNDFSDPEIGQSKE
jgi:hypothetical protein